MAARGSKVAGVWWIALAFGAAPAVARAQEPPRDTWGVTEPRPEAPPAPTEPPPAPAAPAPAPAPPPAPPPPPTAAPEAPPAPPPPSTTPTDEGFSVGARLGFSLPFGTAKGDASLSDVVAHAIPVGLDVGYFLDPHLYLGGFFTYGIASVSGAQTSTCPYSADTSCSAQLLVFGASAHWHLRPKARLDPWLGGSLAYEVLNLRETNQADGSEISSAADHGPAVDLTAGVDFKPLSYVGVGPYVDLGAGRFFGADGLSLHEWLTFGARFRTNL